MLIDVRRKVADTSNEQSS